jgi:hypothetical protein
MKSNNTNIYKEMCKRLLKKRTFSDYRAVTKGARICYFRIYHKFVNFIILNLFKVVK